MLSNQKIQNAVNEIGQITKLKTFLYSEKGKKVASTHEDGEHLSEFVLRFLDSDEEQEELKEYVLFKILIEEEVKYVLVIEHADPSSLVIGQMAACQIRNLVLNSAEQFDRSNFMQNLLLGNLLTVDIYGKAKKLHIEPKRRVVFVIDTGVKSNEMVMELVKNLSDTRSGDFVISLDEHSVILIKDVSHVEEADMEGNLRTIANSLVDNVHMEAMIKVRVGYGNVISQIPEIAESYKEAKLALEVGRVFYAEYDTISYGKLGIGRLIFELPMSLCDMFIKEVFVDGIPDILDDEEAMSTINKFFENNLNISETARQLYVHRNTLVYRLERIEKAIGLDIRTFDDAMTFRIAVMVIAHMRNQGR